MRQFKTHGMLDNGSYASGFIRIDRVCMTLAPKTVWTIVIGWDDIVTLYRCSSRRPVIVQD